MTNAPSNILPAFIRSFRDTKLLADRAVAQLPDDKMNVALDPRTNSIQVIMRHVGGNLRSRWTDFLTSDGEKPWRLRDEEFSGRPFSRAETLADWESGWQCLFRALESLDPKDLDLTVTIRGEPLSVPAACSRSLAHCGYHAGQIVMIARILAGDRWTTLTIPRGGSTQYNARTWGDSSPRPDGHL